jgi:hypothetical protein
VVEVDGRGAGELVVEKSAKLFGTKNPRKSKSGKIQDVYAKRRNRHTVLRAHDYIFWMFGV